MSTTLAAAFVASWLAQAEAAPPEPPASPPTPAPPEAPPARVNTMGVAARFAYRLGDKAKALGPAAGFSLGATFQHRYLALAEGVGLGVGVDLFHDQFAEDVQTAQPLNPAVPSPPDAQRVITQTSFAALQTLTIDVGPAGLWLGAGAGLTIASLSTPETTLHPGSLRAFQPLVRGALGVEIAIAPRMAIGVRADLTHPFTNPTLATTAGPTYAPFGDYFDAGLGFLYRF